MKDSGKIIGAVLLGAVVGAAIGILLAPDKGSETRKKLIAGAQDLKENLGDTVNNILNKVETEQVIAEGKLVEFKKHLKEKSEQHSQA